MTIDYDLAFEEWAETGPARDQYDSDLSDGWIPCERYTVDGCAVNPLPFEEWLNSSAADHYFETWFNEEADPR